MLTEIISPSLGTLVTFFVNPGGVIEVVEPDMFTVRGELLAGGGSFDVDDFPINFRIQAVPEPASLAPLAIGISGLGWAPRRNQAPRRSCGRF
ncbi:MAG: PEP-CTERM sorting domain-containing protein [Pseudomonadota bacterium]